MRVLITGGTGVISTGLVRECVARGFETYAITRGNANYRNIKGANYIHTDVRNMENVHKELEDLTFDVVVECLAYNVSQLKDSLVNFSSKCGQYIFISSVAVYDRVGVERIDESFSKSFLPWSYSKQKIECEEYLRKYATETGLEFTIIRPTVTYGEYRIPFPIETRSPGWTFFDRMQKGKLILGSDNVLFSILHIDDFSKMVVALFGNRKAINEDFHTTSDDNDIFWDDVIKCAGELLGIQPRIVHVSSEVIRNIWPQIYENIIYHKNTTQIFNSAKIESVSGVKASIDLREGINKTINSMRNEFEENELSLDEVWNQYCDATIYYAYKMQLLEDNDYRIVSDYIRVNGENEFVDSYTAVCEYNACCK